tara:strand:- start:8269 stop:9117 length:849 start_codon:yes stop_codon:yes gene_type:complete
MKLSTFYKIYYHHRLVKAQFFLKIYIILILPFVYFLNLFFFPRKKDLDLIQKDKDSLKNLSLTSLFNYFNSDKGDLFEDQYVKPIKRERKKIKGHGYSKFYEKHFQDFKQLSINILELGSFHGNASAAFYFYFEKAKIYGGDIFPDLFRYKSQRIKNFYVDTSNEKSIKQEIIANDKKFDIIIEDASHSFKDQIISLFLLFRKIRSKGLFIVEELDFPDTRDDMNIKKEKPTLREILHSIKSDVEFISKYISDEDKKYFLDNYKSINIYKGNFNEVAIIQKK